MSPGGGLPRMSLSYALAAAINGSTGPRATLSHGLSRTKPRRRRSGQRPTPGILIPQGRRGRCRVNTLQACMVGDDLRGHDDPGSASHSLLPHEPFVGRLPTPNPLCDSVPGGWPPPLGDENLGARSDDRSPRPLACPRRGQTPRRPRQEWNRWRRFCHAPPPTATGFTGQPHVKAEARTLARSR
jgi:hypothetical protein